MTRFLAALAVALSLLVPTLALGQGAQIGSSTTPGAAPTTLQPGELRLNRADKLLFWPRLDGTAAATALDTGPGWRNRVMNGHFSVNQRAVSGTVTLGAGAYGHDRWKAGTGGATYTFAAAANGEATITLTAGTLLQIIPADMIHLGGAYRLSWTGTATCRLYQGSASGSYAASPLAPTLAAGTATTVECGSGTLARVQLEAGTVVTPYEFRGDEQSRCDRFLQRVAVTLRFPASGGGQVGETAVPHRVPMRANPAPSLIAAGDRVNVQSVAVIAYDQYASRIQIISATGGDTIVLGDRWLLSAEP